MATLLHIVTTSPDPLAEDLIARQRAEGGHTVDLVDLTAGSPDYGDLLQRIFAADSVAVW